MNSVRSNQTTYKSTGKGPESSGKGPARTKSTSTNTNERPKGWVWKAKNNSESSKANPLGPKQAWATKTCSKKLQKLMEEALNLGMTQKVNFKKTGCAIEDESGKTVLPGKRYKNVYILDGFEKIDGHICLTSMSDDPWLWHRKLGHASNAFDRNIVQHELVVGLPKLNFSRTHICDACEIGNRTSNSFKNKDIVSTSKPLQLLHMDLFGPTRTASIGGKRYAFVIVDDYSRFTWVIFLSHKDEALRKFEVFCKKVEEKRDIRSLQFRVIMEENLKVEHLKISVEPKKIEEALKDSSWVQAMQEELDQFSKNQNKWVFINKLNEDGKVVRNKARLVTQGYSQQEGVDYDETFALVAHLESIRILLAYASFKGFRLFQMDVKSAFLNGFIEEEVYVKQPSGFVDSKFPYHVYKLTKALYGLKQAPRAWYDRLSSFLVDHGFTRGKVDTTLFIKRTSEGNLIIQIYVDDIIFGSANPLKCKKFLNLIQSEFEMSMMGELTFFIRIQQSEEGTFICQTKYTKEQIQKFGMRNAKSIGTPMSPSTN
ncbi:uncharacterized protein LOC142164954 [Nicotiana tabacum]|uniref:Uncharacterized protein LOC142164954 n=1 Tax=Nicotiana tabacum TaxID=4097 RepID=A0AC58S418_TOBAC